MCILLGCTLGWRLARCSASSCGCCNAAQVVGQFNASTLPALRGVSSGRRRIGSCVSAAASSGCARPSCTLEHRRPGARRAACIFFDFFPSRSACCSPARAYSNGVSVPGRLLANARCGEQQAARLAASPQRPTTPCTHFARAARHRAPIAPLWHAQVDVHRASPRVRVDFDVATFKLGKIY